MKVPVATYRLQFRGEMDFAKAIGIVPYLRDLGVSHLYASPIFTAPAGSTHGYDVADHNEIDPALGGRAGLERLAEALRSASMGLILDIVPNHMAASLENPWWRSVVEWGRESPFANHFDIDWARRLTLPILGRPYAEVLAAGELGIDLDGESGAIALRYFDNRLPLQPSTWRTVLEPLEHPLASRLRDRAALASASDAEALHRETRALCASGEGKALAEELRRVATPDFVNAIHAQQPWELTFWQEARRSLSYRRFFEVTGLVGVRVEQPGVFDDVHRLTLELVRSGVVDGLRIDHVDGLADPTGYLRRLREEAGPDTYIVVEKILARDEELPEDWPIQGTTGYEFIDALSGLLVHPDGVSRLSAAYVAMSGSRPVGELREEAKRQIATVNFEGEVRRLSALISEMIGADASSEAIGRALTQLLVAMPVYRTYNQGSATGRDRSVLDGAVQVAKRATPHLEAVMARLHAILTGDDSEATSAAALEARQRFQQLTGPVMAKSVEDTLFYRDHRLIALNEVGCDPVEPVPSLSDFHGAMAARARNARHALSATATHDTKRGEDARARLLALSEMPERWADAVSSWRKRMLNEVAGLPGGPAPEPEVEWLVLQALAAAWPMREPSAAELNDLRQRFLAFLEKALREAKRRTDWAAADEVYEAAVKNYAVALFEHRSFLQEFSTVLLPLSRAGWHNSLAQTAVKLLAPGIPDIYQGSEAADFSFVDPDNRRQVDFAGLASALKQEEATAFPQLKQRLVARLLRLRGDAPDLFSDGDYLPLEVEGPRRGHIAAFARRRGREAVVAVVARRTMSLMGQDGEISPDVWCGTRVALPASLRDQRLDTTIGGSVEGGDAIDVESAFASPWACVFVAATRLGRG